MLGVKIINFVFFGVKKSGISLFLVSVENGAGVNKMTNMTYEYRAASYQLRFQQSLQLAVKIRLVWKRS